MKLINSFYDKRNNVSKPYYNTEEVPQNYKGFLLFKRTNPWVDVVEVRNEFGFEEYWVVSQRGSIKNAKEFIDSKEEQQ